MNIKQLISAKQTFKFILILCAFCMIQCTLSTRKRHMVVHVDGFVEINFIEGESLNIDLGPNGSCTKVSYFDRIYESRDLDGSNFEGAHFEEQFFVVKMDCLEGKVNVLFLSAPSHIYRYIKFNHKQWKFKESCHKFGNSQYDSLDDGFMSFGVKIDKLDKSAYSMPQIYHIHGTSIEDCYQSDIIVNVPDQEFGPKYVEE